MMGGKSDRMSVQGEVWKISRSKIVRGNGTQKMALPESHSFGFRSEAKR